MVTMDLVGKWIGSKAGLCVLLFSCAPAVEAIQFYVGTQSGKFGVLESSNGAFNQTGIFAPPIVGLVKAQNSTYIGNDYFNNGSTRTTNFYSVDPTVPGRTLLYTQTGDTAYFGEALLGSTVYAIEEDSTASHSWLVTINSATGVPTRVAQTSIVSDGALAVDDLGQMFGTRGLSGSGFYSVNPATAAFTLINVTPGYGTAFCMCFAEGNLYVLNSVGRLYTVNRGTGVATQISQFATGADMPFAMAVVPEPGSFVALVAGATVMLLIRKQRRILIS